VQAYREKRDGAAAAAALRALERTAQTSENLFPFVLDAFRAGATLGEVCGALRREWGEYRG
jgi:methylmalonyl-CoA mutase N-terminal domain/subunit